MFFIEASVNFKCMFKIYVFFSAIYYKIFTFRHVVLVKFKFN